MWIIPADWKRFAVLALAISLLFLVLWAMTGCAWHGVMGDGCVLCDSVPSSKRTILTGELVIEAGPARSTVPTNSAVVSAVPAARFNGTAVVSLDGSLRDLRGDIFQALQSACGITHAEVKDQYEWPMASAHDYGVEMWATTSWHDSIGTVRVNAMVSRVHAGFQRREYIFVKNGSGAATYGDSYGAYGARRIGVYRSADAAIRYAAAAAIANLCGGVVSYSPRADSGVSVPQDVPTPCLPPDCYEQTISVYGTWGGYGINSHWPSRPAYTPPVHHDHRNKPQRHRAFVPRAPVKRR